MAEPLAPGATLGILGGGQLGRMLAMAAARLGYRTAIYEPAADCPAAQVANDWLCAPWGDRGALDRFAALCDCVTLEFENVPVAVLDRLAARVPVRPGRRSLDIAQDRLAEKRFLADLGLATAPFHAVDDEASLAAALEACGGEGILKTRRLGYDGKGQVRLAGGRAAGALEAIGHAPAILEGLVPFTCEISVIAARGPDGAFAAFDPPRNEHREGILRRSTVPSGVAPETEAAAVAAARAILEALDHVGVMGVEFFVSGDGALAVNEIAPRVHNSGHWTEGACLVDQFEQHVRAVCGLPLGDPARHGDAVMENLIGAEVEAAGRWLAVPGTRLHLYGKASVREGRKMGHVTRLLPRM